MHPDHNKRVLSIHLLMKQVVQLRINRGMKELDSSLIVRLVTRIKQTLEAFLNCNHILQGETGVVGHH